MAYAIWLTSDVVYSHRAAYAYALGAHDYSDSGGHLIDGGGEVSVGTYVM